MSDNKRKKMESKKAKAAAKKAKFAAKMGKAAKCAVAFALLAVIGCASSEPASRVTKGEYGDTEPTVKVVFERNANSNTATITLPITIGDAAYASADSKGSTESTTANPTLDIKTDAKFTYGLQSDTAAGSEWLNSLTDTAKQGLAYVLKSGKANGTMCVTKQDGSTECVTCKDGTCTTSAGDCVTCHL